MKMNKWRIQFSLYNHDETFYIVNDCHGMYTTEDKSDATLFRSTQLSDAIYQMCAIFKGIDNIEIIGM